MAEQKPTLSPEQLVQKLTAGNPRAGSVQERAVELLESGNSVPAVTEYLDTYKDRQRGGKWYGAGERGTSPRER